MSRRKNRRPSKDRSVKEIVKSHRGVDRRRFFEEGGVAVRWRGGCSGAFPDRKKANNRRACRDWDLKEYLD